MCVCVFAGVGVHSNLQMSRPSDDPTIKSTSTIVDIVGVAGGRFAVIASGCFFSVCSVGMLLVNKCAFTGSSFNSGLIFGQNVGTCLLALCICCLAPSFRFSPSISKFVTWAPVVVLFVGTIVSSASALAIVNVTTFSVFRNASSLVVAVFEFFLLQKTVSSYQLVFLILVVVGAVIYGWGDLQFSVRGYFLSALHVLIASMSAVAVKKLNVNFSSSLEMSLYNNVGSLPLLFIFASYEYQASSSQIIIRNQQCAAASVPAAFLISLSALMSQKLLSATSWMALNNFNKIPVLVLSHFIFSDTYSIFQACGLAISVAASVGYSYSSSFTFNDSFTCFNFGTPRSLPSLVRAKFFRLIKSPLFVVTLFFVVAALQHRTLLTLFSNNSHRIISSTADPSLSLNHTSSRGNISNLIISSTTGSPFPIGGIISEGKPNTYSDLESYTSSRGNSSNHIISSTTVPPVPIGSIISEEKSNR